MHSFYVVTALPRSAHEVRAAKALDTLKVPGDEQIGIDIVRRSCEEPVRQIVGNAGYEGAIVIEKIRANRS